MENLTYISVILPLKLDWEPCYSVVSQDISSSESIVTGTRVRVRFSGKEYVGTVSATGIEPDIDKKKILPVSRVEKGLEKISENEIRLWRKVSEYYMCTTGEVYKAAYPLLKIDQEMVAAREDERKAERARKLEEAWKQRVEKLQGRLAAKEEKLSVTTAPKAKVSLQEGIRKLNAEIAAALSARQADSCQDVPVQTEAHPAAHLSVTQRQLSPLSGNQEKAYGYILETFRIHKPVLLKGVTGSGKTEIYMHLAEDCLKRGLNVLYMVPEIAMSMQLEARLRDFFGERLLVFHSKENLLSKRRTAEAIRKVDSNYILLGTRSALFLPHDKLGLVIIDEEHDNSYKQESPVPKYNGRDTALMLSQLQPQACDVILGSATPSLESLYNCHIGKYRQIDLNEKYFKGTVPDIEIIDTIAERKKRGMVGNFSRKLIGRINATLARKEQVIILRARRSYSPVLQCQECGEIPKCPHCNVSLSYSKAGNRMICHYCGWSRPYDGICPSCKGELKFLGAGTQKIEEEAIQLFPEASIARLDSDSAQNKNFEKRVINDFAAGRTDILIGTQMIAKGFDFENVTLVVLLQADAILGLQDFRADEKAMQLMEQLRGRCGRREKQGTFIIQTSQSSHPIYTKMTDGSSGQIYGDLLMERKDFHFPPFTRIITIEIKDSWKERAEQSAYALAAGLKSGTISDPAFNVTGPYAPAIDKIADHHIRCVRISLPKDKNLRISKQRLYARIEKFCRERKYNGHLSIDVDPI